MPPHYTFSGIMIPLIRMHDCSFRRSTNATDKYAAVERLERAIEGIQASIEDEGGSCIVKMKVRFFEKIIIWEYFHC